MLKAMVREGLATLRDDSFDKEGRTIHYRRVELTGKGYSFDKRDIVTIQLPFKEVFKKKSPAKKHKIRKASIATKTSSGDHPELYQHLRAWRNGLAKKRGVPAFRIFSNNVLNNLCSDLPTTEDELFMVNGIGPYFVEKYGDKVINMIKGYLRKD